MEYWSGPEIDIKRVNENRKFPRSLPIALMEWQQKWSSSDSECLADKARRFRELPISPSNHSSEPELSSDVSEYYSSEESFRPVKTMIITSDSESNFSTINNASDNSGDPIIPMEIKPLKVSTKASISRQLDGSGKEEDVSEIKLPCKRKLKLTKKQRDIQKFKTQESHEINQSENKAIKQAREKSLKMELMKQSIYRLHQKRLSILLKSNGLQQIPIAADGNCFMEAVSAQLDTRPTSQELRTRICEHLYQNESIYIDFFSSSQKTQEENHCDYQVQVEDLKSVGHWVSNLADALPLAVSNIFHCSIDIYTSKALQPVINIERSLGVIGSHEPIKLCYTAAPGQEHYGICQTKEVPKQGETTPKTTDQNYVDLEEPFASPEKEEASEQMQYNHNEANQNAQTPQKRCTHRDILSQMTPRKQAKFLTPPKKKVTRKKQKHEDKWKTNLRKTLRQSGKEYISVKGKIVKQREMKSVNCSKCRFKCSQHVDENERQALFDSYWSLGCDERQRDFLCAHVLEKESANRTGKSQKRKMFSRNFTFHLGGNIVRVCKIFFISTLGISERLVDYTLQNIRNKTVPITPKDRRGKKSPANKTPKSVIEGIRQHIDSFPKTSSHYTRKDSKRQYLSSDLSITKLYELYTEQCKEKGVRVASFTVYRRIFCTEYNLSFHVPKKDQCEFCNKYTQRKQAGTLDEEMELSYNIHQERKLNSRLEKSKDKDQAKADENFHAATFDLESVLPTPCSLVSQAYYKRKLNCYNFSVYSLGDNKGQCFLWNETEEGRGSCEVGTCLYLYLNSMPSKVQHVCFYSDSCIGQNRNKFVAAALQHAVLTNQNLQVVEQKFLERGHTQMECDSMHAAVEYAKKKTPVFIPSQWDTVVRMARRKKPYIVIPIKNWDIIDFKKIASSRFQNAKTSITGDPVAWLKIKWIQFRKSEPDYMFYKYDMHEDEFRILKCKLSRRGRPESLFTDLPRRYTERLAISSSKKKDLLDLCKALIIPQDHHAYYSNLPSSTAVKDKLPEPDQQEEETDSEQD